MTSVSSEYQTRENLPNNGAGTVTVTETQLLNTAAYVESKKLGIGNAIGSGAFPGGEQEILQRIEITGLVIDTSVSPPKVVTQFRINDISTIATGQQSSSAISNIIADATSFQASVLNETVHAIAA